MKKFFRDYSYSIVRMLVYQIAISIFGISLYLATTFAAINWLIIITSAFAILFYLVLLYILTWEIGAKDRVSVDYGKKKKNIGLGFILSFFANVPNLLLATISLICSLFRWETVFVVSRVVAAIIQGMYMGVLDAINMQGIAVSISFYIIVIPAILVCGIAYIAGFNNFRIFPAKKNDKK